MLETIVADLEYCKELKELGVKQESIFYHNCILRIHDKALEVQIQDRYLDPPERPDLGEFSISAWTDTELAFILKPFEDNDFNVIEFNCQYMAQGDWAVIGFDSLNETYECMDKEGGYHELYIQDKDKPANARAKMLIYLLKNNIISLEEVNKNI